MTIYDVWLSIFVIYQQREVWATLGQPVQIVEHDPVRAGSAWLSKESEYELKAIDGCRVTDRSISTRELIRRHGA